MHLLLKWTRDLRVARLFFFRQPARFFSTICSKIAELRFLNNLTLHAIAISRYPARAGGGIHTTCHIERSEMSQSLRHDKFGVTWVNNITSSESLLLISHLCCSSF